MQKNIALTALLFVACVLQAAEATPPGLEVLPEIVGDVEGRPVYRSDLIRELVGSAGMSALDRLARRVLVEQAAANLNIAVTAEEVEQQYKADTRKLMSELIRMPWDKDRNGNIIRKEFPMEDVLQARFRMSTDEYKKLVVRQSLLIKRCVAKDLNPTPQQLRKFFNDYPLMFNPPAKYHAAHILISPIDPRDLHRGLVFQSPTSRMTQIERERLERINLYRDHNCYIEDGPNVDQMNPEWLNSQRDRSFKSLDKEDVKLSDRLAPEWVKSKAQAEKVLKDIKSGAITWDQAVRKYTQDPIDQPAWNRKTKQWDEPERTKLDFNSPGDLGWFQMEGPLVYEFYDGVKSMKPGEISGPIQTRYGFHIVKMVEIKTPPPANFDECIGKIREVYIENAIQLILMPEAADEKSPRPPGWLDVLAAQAKLDPPYIDRTVLWPPARVTAGNALDPAPVHVAAATDPDPIVAKINGSPIRRSEIWRELIRSEADEALDRLINREVIMTILKPYGVPYLEWLCSSPENRKNNPPPQPVPIKISSVSIDRQLTDDRIASDAENEAVRGDPNKHEKSFKEYIYDQYGLSEEEFRRSVESTLVLAAAVRSKVPTDEATLKVQFALAREQYTEPANYEVSHILISPAEPNEVAWMNALRIAEQLFKQCNENPESFNQLVKEYSDDKETKNRNGSVGKCFANRRRPAFAEEAVFYATIRKNNVGRGQFAPLIKSPRGYHIVRVDAVHSEQPAEFNEVKRRLERDYLNERAKMYSDIWLRELNRQAKINKHLGTKATESTEPRDNFDVPTDENEKKRK